MAPGGVPSPRLPLLDRVLRDPNLAAEIIPRDPSRLTNGTTYGRRRKVPPSFEVLAQLLVHANMSLGCMTWCPVSRLWPQYCLGGDVLAWIDDCHRVG